MTTTAPQLNYLDLEALAQHLNTKLSGARFDRVFIPALSEHPAGYFKQEICLELYSEGKTFQMLVCLRSNACGVVLLNDKILKPAVNATHSGLDLALAKHLSGLRVQAISTIKNERILQLNFGNANHSGVSLLLYLLPAKPGAALIQSNRNGKGEKIEPLFQSNPKIAFTYPTPRTELDLGKQKINLHSEYGTDFKKYNAAYLHARVQSALLLRHEKIERELKSREQYWEKKRKSYQEMVAQNQHEPDWENYGKIFQLHFHAHPMLEKGHYTLTDFEGALIKIPGDAKLNPKQQLDAYFKKAKRIKTRSKECTERLMSANEKLAELKKLTHTPLVLHAPLLQEVESALGLAANINSPTPLNKNKLAQTFSGKQFISPEGLPIFVGRNLAENLDLTFKIAKGNDLWFHVKGKPGSHAVILLPPKKTASLDTLLDAAHLCIFYSGGKEWGKTEVDYTFRKHVKKIKNQKEVSYTHNKTLMVNFELKRLDRYLKNGLKE